MLKAPFPYFGGKLKVAKIIWQALGQPRHYMEPFFGSGAVLLTRPNYDPQKHIETICDKDGNIANVWRSIQWNPDEVAKWCDWPNNHADLIARKRRLKTEYDRLLQNIIEDDEYYNAKLAGYWIWCASTWIGCGSGDESIQYLSKSEQGIHKISLRKQINSIYKWFDILSKRIRFVRIVCGNWDRIIGGNWQKNFGSCGIFFDPPYFFNINDDRIYKDYDLSIAGSVRKWALKRADDPYYKIVISGYDEHSELINHGWSINEWISQGGYNNRNNNNKNRYREKLYFSPHCNKTEKQLKLF